MAKFTLEDVKDSLEMTQSILNDNYELIELCKDADLSECERKHVKSTVKLGLMGARVMFKDAYLKFDAILEDEIRELEES